MELIHGPQERWERVRRNLLAQIIKINDATRWSEREPQWWLEMMECDRLLRRQEEKDRQPQATGTQPL